MEYLHEVIAWKSIQQQGALWSVPCKTTRFAVQKYYIKNEIFKLPVKKEWRDETYEERVARVTIELAARLRRLKRRAKRQARCNLQEVSTGG